MTDVKYIGMDVHQASISIAVVDGGGTLLMQSTIRTQASTLLEFLCGLKGALHVTFEEGTWSGWLYDLLAPHVAQVVACDPRHNALLKSGNKSDKINARKLAELLRAGMLKAVYHGQRNSHRLKELSRSYLTLVHDGTRVMNRLKAIYRSQGIHGAGQRVYSRAEWLEQLREPGLPQRAAFLYQQLDGLQALRKEARRLLLTESRKHPAHRLLLSVPGLGLIRVALLLALIQTPHRFRSKRQLWAYASLALITRTSADNRLVQGSLPRSRKPIAIRGLNQNHNHDLKEIFKSAALRACRLPGPWRDCFSQTSRAGNEAGVGSLDHGTQARRCGPHSLEEGRTLQR